MKITDKQRAVLSTLCCERLSSNEKNLRSIGCFCNNRNSCIVDTLLGEAYEEDECGAVAYYLVKNNEDDILFFFSLKCGLLYDEFIEGERLRSLQAFYDYISRTMSDDEIGEEEKSVLGSLLEKTRTKKGLKKTDVAKILHKSSETTTIEEMFDGGVKNVGKTFPGIEIVHFCANDSNREKWDQYAFDQKIGVVVFWHFIIPVVQKAMEHVGCEYLFLFAADMTEDEELVNYYKTNMNFRDTIEHGTAMPLYDFACKFMYQETKGLVAARDNFFNSFNRDEDAV